MGPRVSAGSAANEQKQETYTTYACTCWETLLAVESCDRETAKTMAATRKLDALYAEIIVYVNSTKPST